MVWQGCRSGYCNELAEYVLVYHNSDTDLIVQPLCFRHVQLRYRQMEASHKGIYPVHLFYCGKWNTPNSRYIKLDQLPEFPYARISIEEVDQIVTPQVELYNKEHPVNDHGYKQLVEKLNKEKEDALEEAIQRVKAKRASGMNMSLAGIYTFVDGKYVKNREAYLAFGGDPDKFK